MPRKPNPAAPSCPVCGRPHMQSQGTRWRCGDPLCRKSVAKSGGKPGKHHKHGAVGGTESKERTRASRKRTGKTGNEARDRRRKEAGEDSLD
jgi:hypothetical protein